MRVSLANRADVVHAVPGRLAAVAVPVVPHPTLGDCLVVTRRSTVNGHTGGRMTNAGDVVLFGGSIEAGETPADAALRELCEEAGTPGLAATVGDHLGTWTTEAGFVVEGFAVDLPASFVSAAVPDAREVAEIAYLPVAAVLAAEARPEYHRVDPRDHRLGDEDVELESPTLHVVVEGATWTLWGLAGYMVDRWVAGWTPS